jgi:hypothetical protein
MQQDTRALEADRLQHLQHKNVLRLKLFHQAIRGVIKRRRFRTQLTIHPFPAFQLVIFQLHTSLICVPTTYSLIRVALDR